MIGIMVKAIIVFLLAAGMSCCSLAQQQESPLSILEHFEANRLAIRNYDVALTLRIDEFKKLGDCPRVFVKLAGLAEPLGVTSNHSIYSADRLDFVPAGELRVKETLRNLDGDVQIESIEQPGSKERVYNLEFQITI